jgi:hypothetical protein
MAGLRAAQKRAHAGEELGHGEGLGDVVVGAGGEAAHAIRLLAARGQHDHRQAFGVAAQADAAAQLDAGKAEGITPTARESTESWAWETLKESLDHIVLACGQQPACAARYSQLGAQLNELATKLEASPFRTTAKGPDGQAVDVVLDGGALMGALRRSAFNPADIPLIIDEAAKGNPQKLAQRWADTSAPPPPSGAWHVFARLPLLGPLQRIDRLHHRVCGAHQVEAALPGVP